MGRRASPARSGSRKFFEFPAANRWDGEVDGFSRNDGVEVFGGDKVVGSFVGSLTLRAGDARLLMLMKFSRKFVSAPWPSLFGRTS